MKINMKNLKKAREGLMGLDPEAFDMELYRSNKDRTAVNFKSKNNCGTVGCALGWCPFIPGLETKKEDYSYSDFLGFDDYCKRVFNFDMSSSVGMYLFDGEWAARDNTIEGLIKRMTRVIDGKKYRQIFNRKLI